MTESMEVDATHLHAGADRCADAAATALKAAGKLADKAPKSGMFGDFAAAHEFHAALSAAHQAHVEKLQGHHRELIDIGYKSRSGANSFTAQDADGADSVRAVGSAFDGL